MTWPVDRNPVWEVAHLGYLVADDAGLGRDYVGRVYQARWEQGCDICDRDVIAGIAAELGLDAGRVAGACEDEELRRRGAEVLVRSYRDGLFGVPFFARGQDRFFGVDRLRAYVAAIRGDQPLSGVATSWLDELVELPELVRPGGDGGPAGGCG
jgi:2-hydroxychromene-2-carboxylate isomerase